MPNIMMVRCSSKNFCSDAYSGGGRREVISIGRGPLGGGGRARLQDMFGQLEGFDLKFGLQVLRDPLKKTQVDEYDKAVSHLQALQKKIVRTAKVNFETEDELYALVGKIKVALRATISTSNYLEYESVHAGHCRGANGGERQDNSQLVGNQINMRGYIDFVTYVSTLYEELFRLLQNEPRYLAKLTRMISVKDSRKYTKIIVYELFGDQHDPREEKLLLGLFCMIFKDEMETE
eukprot:1359024-Amorphochlora_amoeboformis.AAC.1